MGRSSLALAVLLPLLVLAAGVAAIRSEPVLAEEVRQAVRPLARATQVGVVGNSVAASLGEAALEEALEETPSPAGPDGARGGGADVVGNAALPGTFPAHWTAALARVRQDTGALPPVLLIYVPAENLLATGLTDPEDVAHLAALGPERVPGLVDRALGGALPDRGLLVGRVALREAVVQAGSKDLAAALWPGVETEGLSRALTRLQGPVAARSEGARGFLAGVPVPPAQRSAPESAAATASVLPLLAAEAAAGGARLVVAIPVEQGGPQPPPCAARRAALPDGVAFLAERGADVIDLRGLRTSAVHHQTRHHLSAAGQPVVARALVEGLSALGLSGGRAATAGGRLWAADCGLLDGTVGGGPSAPD